MPERSALDRVIEAVSDGAPVDWDAAAESLATREQRDRLAQLRVIEEIARFHGSDEDATTTLAAPSTAKDSLGRWGSLELRNALGSGAFGRVYEAWDSKLAREVALKLVETGKIRGIDPESYLREGRLLARVRHPNVAQVFGADVHEGSAGIWMELIRGRTLESLITEDGPFGDTESARIGIELCRGLAAVHAAGVLHRDVKTSNVMRERGGRIVLMDLGAGFDTAAEASRAGETTGTPFYMAPEVLRGEPASVRSDVYSLGIVLFRSVSARFPVEAQSLGELAALHASGRRRSLRDLRPSLAPEFIRIVERATASDPDNRFASAGELQAALESLTAVERRTHRAFPPRIAIFGAALLVAVAAVTVPILLRSGSAPLRVQAALYRTNDGTRERLAETDAIGRGDRLSMTFQSSEKVYAYVLNQDDSGQIHLLFPLAGLLPGNPLPAGTLHTLPGSLGDRPQAWVASGSAGSERFLIVASRAPLTEFEADLAALPQPTPDPGARYAKLSVASERRLRSVSGLVADDATQDSTAIFDRLERLGEGETGSSGVWIRQLKLQSR